MDTIKGIYTDAILHTVQTNENRIDDYAVAQIKALCDNPAFEGSKVCIMPDVHPGMVGTIGFTAEAGSHIIPNVIGIDIGCGMTLAQIKGKTKEYQKLDTVIRDNIPSGFAVRRKVHSAAMEFDFESLRCVKHVNKEKAILSLGTLGGGNHFIEMDQDEDKNTYVVIHTGSRHLGKEVTEYYLREGQKQLKSQGVTDIPYELTYLEGSLAEDYLHDLDVVQQFASLNREIILDELCKGMKWKILDLQDCIHNYVDFSLDIPMIRKGAISAKKDEKVIIPINMKEGIILGNGLGNTEWNYSAPHGAGRIMKRESVKQSFTVSQFKSEMKGIYTSCIGKDTLDEAPFAYRGLNEIKEAIADTVVVEKVIRPIYNFKAGGN